MYNYELRSLNKDKTYWQGKYVSDFIQDLEQVNRTRYRNKGRIIDLISGEILVKEVL